MDIDTLKKLAGINEFQGYTEYKIDENPSITATALKQKERDMGIKPGDKDWFKLWFSKPYMTGQVQFRGRKKK
jgi:hypothetical protein|tara:strand:+ start:4554 stop:4772 length:219 start_codon:yes stop_codon:yes gene_type:complete